MTIENDLSLETPDLVFRQFIREKELMGLRPRTIDNYRKSWKLFCKKIDVDLESINTEVIQDFIELCKNGSNMNVNSINKYLRDIRTILNWMIENKFISPLKVKLIKVDDKLKEPFSSEEIKILLRKPNREEITFVSMRTWAIIAFVVATGARVRNVAELYIKDLDFENYLISFNNTKSRKQYIVPMAKELKTILNEWLEIRKGISSDPVFCSVYGESMQAESIGRSVARYCKNRGVSKTSIHLLRHSYALHMLTGGVDVAQVSRLLGHSSIVTTMRYLNLSGSNLATNKFDDVNPLNNLSGSKRRKRIIL